MKKALVIFVILGAIGVWYSNRSPDLPEPIAYSNVIASDALAERSSPVNDARRSDDEIAASPPEAAPRNDSMTSPSPSPLQGEGIPDAYNLEVPFQSQAPHANWELPYQEACEEASLIMAGRFFSGESLSAEEMDSEIKKLVAWEQDTFGYYEDTTAGEVVRMAADYFNLNATLDYDTSVENIQRHIVSGKLVVVPAAGRILQNPYFSGEGPLYHMLVIRGYTPTHFITNDPGTRRGEEFIYTHDALINAIHDWPREHGGFKDNVTEDEMHAGTPVLIVLDK
ncbi:MAG: C39 family peptidase [Patescibacteria group bacterium]